MKILFHSLGFLFIQLTISFVLQKIFGFMMSHSSSLGLFWTTNVLCTHLYLCLCCGQLSTFTPSSSELQVLCWGFWSTWSYVLQRVRDKGVVSIVCLENKHLASRDLQEAKNIQKFIFCFPFFSTPDLTFVCWLLIHTVSVFNFCPGE